MSATVPLAMFGWIPFSLGLFLCLSPRRAILASYVLGWLFLPIASFPVRGLPDYNKSMAICLAVLLGLLIFDRQRQLLSFRPRWIDLPLLLFIVSPIPASLSNGLGLYDGCSSALTLSVKIGVPYVLGRTYFRDFEGLRDLAIALVLGGLIYVPFCLFEVRMSPQLHRIVYGYHQHDFLQTKRFGGFRPMVFMQHGLAVGMWMTTAALSALVLWRGCALRKVAGVWIGVPFLVLLATAVLCKSTGSIVLLAGGTFLYLATAKLKTRALVLLLVASAPVYLGLRLGAGWNGEELVEAVAQIHEKRAASLGVRLHNEEELIDRALERPWFGWGGHGRAFVYDEHGEKESITDSVWIIYFGRWGYLGLLSFIGLLVLPGLVLVAVVPARSWLTTVGSPALAVLLIAGLYVVDSMANSMHNPIYILGIGGLAGLSRPVFRRLPELLRRHLVRARRMSRIKYRMALERARQGAASRRSPGVSRWRLEEG